jgi:hypothetical protein
MEPSRKTAIYKLAPGCAFSIRDPSGTAEIVNWTDNGTGISQPTKEEIQTELDSQNLEWTANEYARNRKEEYDALTQFELISDDANNGTTTHKDAVNAIKVKYPKPE